MATSWDQVLLTVDQAIQDPQPFLALLKQNGSRNGQFKVAEFLQVLPQNGQKRLCGSLQKLCEWCVARFEEESDELVEQGEGVALVLGGVVVFARNYVQQDSLLITNTLAATVALLHEVLLHIDFVPSLQNNVSLLLELWILKNLPDWQQLVPNSTLYLGARSLSEGSKLADTKRMWSLREALRELDYDHESSICFKRLLLTCYLSHNYLRSEEGKKFLSHLFCLNLNFVEDIHQTIKYQLPGAPVWLVQVYGGVYYRAWRLATGAFVKRIEEDCLQDLMYHAVHAHRQGNGALFQTLRKLLDCLHCESTQTRVQEMLYRLYKPILWRSLKVANSHVRANAATLLMDVFPLYDPECSEEDVDQSVQHQFDIMRELLQDPCEMVRVITVAGVCRVLSCYWEMIPAHVIKSLLTHLVTNLAFDTSSASVRVAVLKGMCVVLQNRLSHPLMKNLLPILHNHLHDVSERVRLALLDLLLVVKGMRTIKFGSICPLEHLLAHMDDSPHVAKRLCALLMEAFRPSQQSSEQLIRCMELLEFSIPAARKFYQLVAEHMPVNDVARFIVVLLRYVSECVTSGTINIQNVPKNDCLTESETVTVKSTEQVVREKLTPEDTQLLTGLLEVGVILWESGRGKLDKHAKLMNEVAAHIPVLLEYMKEDGAQETIYLLASFLPKQKILSVAQRSLLSLTSVSERSQLSLLIGLVSWGMEKEVLVLVSEGLSSELIKERKRRRDTYSTTIDGCRGHLAISILNNLMTHPFLLKKVAEVECFWSLSNTLQKSMTAIEQCLATGSHNSSAHFLSSSLSAYIRIIMHKQTQNEDANLLETVVQDVLTWCEHVVLNHHSSSSSSSSSSSVVAPRRNQRKRRSEGVVQLADCVVESLLILLSDLLLVGLSTDTLDHFIGQFASAVLTHQSVVTMPCFFFLVKLLYQLIESSRRSDVAGIAVTTVGLTPVIPAMNKLLQHVATLSTCQPDHFAQCWSTAHPFLSHAVATSVLMSSLPLGSHSSPVFTSLAQTMLTALCGQLLVNPFVPLSSETSELPCYVSCVCQLVSRSTEAQRLLLDHVDWHVQEIDIREEKNMLLLYLSLIHISSSLCKVPNLDRNLFMLIKPVIRYIQSTSEPLDTNLSDIYNHLKQSSCTVQQILLSQN